MKNNFRYRAILLIASIGLCPIALSYGVAPRVSIPHLFDFSADTINASHIFRAIMGLYFGMIFLWMYGFFIPKIQTTALLALVVFMLGLAAGRLLSFMLDGWPDNLLLISYFFLELTAGLLGLWSYKKMQLT